MNPEQAQFLRDLYEVLNDRDMDTCYANRTRLACIMRDTFPEAFTHANDYDCAPGACALCDAMREHHARALMDRRMSTRRKP